MMNQIIGLHMSKFLHFLAFHDWSEWSIPKTDHNKYAYQIRFCKICNKIIHRWI